MMRVPAHEAALIDRAIELERMAQRLRQVAAGDWPRPADESLLEGWSLGERAVEVLVGTRAASGKIHRSAPLLVLDERRGLALTTHQTYRLGARKEDQR